MDPKLLGALGGLALAAVLLWPSGSSHRVKKLYEEGEKLYGQAEYEGAIEKYEVALEESKKWGVKTEVIDKDFHTLAKYKIAVSYSKMNSVRAEKYHRAKELGYTLLSYVSSRCSFLTQHPVGDNVFILEDNTIQPFVNIGNNVTLWSGNHIGHDVMIDDHCFLASHIVVSGHVHIHSHCFIGVNATIRNGIELAPQTLVGAGSVIMKNTAEGDVYVAARAKKYPKKSHEMGI